MITPIDNWRALDSRGVMMPWYSRPCLEWLESVPIEGFDVFEYGCGVSSLWYVSKLTRVCGVDVDRDWVWMPRQSHEPDERYYVQACKSVWDEFNDEAIKSWDIIIIDGHFRDDCTEHALQRLKKGGYLIADNFEQASADLPDWPKTRELTKHLPLTLYKEPTHPDWQTAVWHNV